MMRDQGHGAHFKVAITGNSIRLAGFAFVDDSKIVETARDAQEMASEVRERAQEGLDLFVSGMRATGGDVRPDKSWWCQIEFEWKRGKWPCALLDEEQEMSVLTADGRREKIPHLGPGTAKKMLGVWLAPDGSNDKAVEEMSEQARIWADKVRSGHISRHAAWSALNSRIIKKLQYPLLALTLDKKECQKTEWPMLKYGLPASGISRTFPRDVLHGPAKFQGINLPSIFTSDPLDLSARCPT